MFVEIFLAEGSTSFRMFPKKASKKMMRQMWNPPGSGIIVQTTHMCRTRTPRMHMCALILRTETVGDLFPIQCLWSRFIWKETDQDGPYAWMFGPISRYVLDPRALASDKITADDIWHRTPPRVDPVPYGSQAGYRRFIGELTHNFPRPNVSEHTPKQGRMQNGKTNKSRRRCDRSPVGEQPG